MMKHLPTSLKRREVLAAGAAGLLLPGTAMAKLPVGMTQAPYFYRFKLGTAECTVVTDGQLPLGDPNAAFLKISKEEINRELTGNFLPTSNAVLEQNILIVNFGDRVVLFDTGMGSLRMFGDSTGKLMSTIKAAGIDPAGVDAVVMSHAHVDHCGGLITDDGKQNFPNATYYIGEPDFNYWTNDSVIPDNYPARANFLGQARKNLLPVREQLVFYKDNQEIIPGITALSAPGHTVSHTIFMINSGNDHLCYVGDLAHHPVLLLEHPRTQFAYDTDPAQSAESRVRMMNMFAANRTTILAYHFAWPGIGHVVKWEDGFKFLPQPVNLQGVNSI